MNTNWNRTPEERERRRERAKAQWASGNLSKDTISQKHRDSARALCLKRNSENNPAKLESSKEKLSVGGALGAQRRYRRNPTRLEKVAIAIFDAAEVSYQTQVQFGRYCVDFVIGKGILEVDDGNIKSSRKEAQTRRDQYLKKLGYQVVHLSGKEISSNPSCILDCAAIMAGGGF